MPYHQEMWRTCFISHCSVVLFLILITLCNIASSNKCGFSLADKVNIDTFKYNLSIIRSNNNDSWSINLYTAWENPGHNQDGYLVRLISTEETGQKFNLQCEFPNYTPTMSESFLFTNLSFGHEYQIRILLFDSVTNKTAPYPAYTTITTPDCFQSTQSVEFCSKQPIPVSSPIREFRADCQTANTYGNETDILLSWLPPVQINGSISEFFIGIRPTYQEPFAKVEHLKISQDEPELNMSQPVSQEVKGLAPNTSYYIQVKPFVIRVNDDEKRQGEAVEEKIHLTVVSAESLFHNNTSGLTPFCIPEKPATVIPTAHLSSPQASLWAVLGASAGMVCMTTVMFLVIVRKKRSVEVKRTEFVRYPDGVTILGGSVIKKNSSVLPMTKFVDPNFASKELDRSHLEIGEELGKGSFGVVYKGLVYGLDGNQRYTSVAVKSLRVGSNEMMKLEFLDEIRLIIEIGNHPNILPLLGCCTVDEPFYLVTELMKYGDLLNFLIKCRDKQWADRDPIYDLTPTMQLQIAAQISRGMEYISSTRYYHGDLAARNVLVGEHLVVKISDFGMADDIYQRGYKRLAPSKKRPVKWVSLETNVEGRCSIESDVWSFGIVLYEIYTLGGTPYRNMDGQDVINKLKEGYRMDKPEECPDDMYTLMLHCWQEKPSSRPTFTSIYNTLDTMLSASSDYLTNLDPPEKYSKALSSSFTDETDVDSLKSSDRYSSLLIAPRNNINMNSFTSDYEDYSSDEEHEYVSQSDDIVDPAKIIPAILVNSPSPGECVQRKTAFVNESYQSHPV
ncbi:Myoblast growth factor receptor egl-15 [Holothuria leucospilota]|uniref:receptor protein-tyrosine kinase n=1 Tax=Holothuria leucospilota TaxID=206669 RepID=A0A9Q1H1Y7_HOLLE|nr:Myoblast growth factor receptor egl-15 [Holothuria leucospilota]